MADLIVPGHLSLGVLGLALLATIGLAWSWWQLARTRRAARGLAAENGSLRRSEERFRSIIWNASDVIVILTAHGRILYQSPAAERVWGYQPEALHGTAVASLIHPEDRARAEKLIAQSLFSPRLDLASELRLRNPGGAWCHFEVIVNNLLADPGVAGIVATFRDISFRMRAEAELQESNHRLEVAIAELKRAQQQVIEQERLRALGEMASGIAHDFNNTLAPILGYSELLLDWPGEMDDVDKVRTRLGLMRTAAQDAAHIVARLREFYRRHEAGDVLLPTELAELVRQTVSLTQFRWKDQALAKGINVEVRTELAELPPVAANEPDLREALTNLILNAVDAMPNGGTLTIRTRAEDGRPLLEVIDTGIGMSDEVRRRCLEPFFTTKGDRGTGLGLGMVYGIACRHQGTLEIDTEPGRGTTVRLRLIFERRGQRRHVPSLPRTGTTRPLRILSAEDDPVVARVLYDCLSRDGHTIEQAANGEEAVAKLRDERFDLVLTDRAMPGMNGDQLAAFVKQHSPETPVLMLTGFGQLMLDAGERPPGVSLVLSKPVTPERLRQAVAVLAGGREAIETPNPGPSPAEADAPKPDGARATVLIADDTEQVRRVCRDVLSARGYAVLEAEDGHQAVAAYHEHRPDVALVDLDMPGLDGQSVVEAIRRQDPDARVAIMTGDGEGQATQSARERGAREYIAKPFQADELVTTLEKLLAA